MRGDGRSRITRRTVCAEDSDSGLEVNPAAMQ
jgi:hypothetical protein